MNLAIRRDNLLGGLVVLAFIIVAVVWWSYQGTDSTGFDENAAIVAIHRDPDVTAALAEQRLEVVRDWCSDKVDASSRVSFALAEDSGIDWLVAPMVAACPDQLDALRD